MPCREGFTGRRADNHYFIGISARTNREGAQQLSAILEKHGYTSSLTEARQRLTLAEDYLSGFFYYCYENS